MSSDTSKQRQGSQSDKASPEKGGLRHAQPVPDKKAKSPAKTKEKPLTLNGRPVAETTVSDIFGQAVWLLTQSPTHKNFFLSDLEWMVMPPVVLRQFRIFPGKNQPLGMALWAKISEEVEDRLLAGNMRISPQDWNSGDRYWLLDLIAPFGHNETMLTDLQKTTFKGKTFKMHSVKDGKREIITITGEGA